MKSSTPSASMRRPERRLAILGSESDFENGLLEPNISHGLRFVQSLPGVYIANRFSAANACTRTSVCGNCIRRKPGKTLYTFY